MYTYIWQVGMEISYIICISTNSFLFKRETINILSRITNNVRVIYITIDIEIKIYKCN